LSAFCLGLGLGIVGPSALALFAAMGILLAAVNGYSKAYSP
jgi:hypothetical protein